MKERPMLFSGPMVRAILEGRKTQTRRVIKHGKCLAGYVRTLNLRCMLDDIAAFRNAADEAVFIRCPYGQPGDRLWVRETFYTESIVGCDSRGNDTSRRDIFYRASCREDPSDAPITWRPSIHMPRWASRITLEVTGVWVERLQTISLDDAKAEGVETIDQYAELWAKINGWGSWHADPWVWVVAFKRAAQAGKDVAK